jgi:type IV fimbrial biogenesis protein FimT
VSFVPPMNKRFKMNFERDNVKRVRTSGQIIPLTRNQGFTLVEMVVVLSILGIAVAIAMPSFIRFVQNNRLATTANAFVGALNLARSEAITRGVTVTVCKSPDQIDCVANGDWAQGWIVFMDPDNDGEVADADDILRVYDGLPAPSTFVGTANVSNRVSYAPTGFPAVLSSGTVALTIGGRTINVVLNTTGRVRTDR